MNQRLQFAGLTGIRSPNRAEALCSPGCAISSYEILASWISTFSMLRMKRTSVLRKRPIGTWRKLSTAGQQNVVIRRYSTHWTSLPSRFHDA